MQYGFGVQGIKISLEQNTEISFYFCLNMETFRIPESITLIEDNAFYECYDTVFEVVQGSYAEAYCQQYNISYKYE